MFGNRRLAKRSIVGTKIAALRQDGRFYPGVIRSQYAEEGPFTEAVYTVVFDDGFEKNVRARDIIGQGFQTISNVALKNGQKVYVTLNGREVNGTVIDHDRTIDEALINVRFHTGEEMEISKKLDDVRLLQSRKSARLVDQDTDYSKLADLQLIEPKREGPISREIDVPVTAGQHWQSGHDGLETEDKENNVRHDVEMELEDESIAALALTSLSCSPASPRFQGSKELSIPVNYQDNLLLSTSASSSGFSSNHSERSDPSPPFIHLSASDPSSTGMMFGPFVKDEEIEEEKQIKTMYKCTWKKCGKICSTNSSIEAHVRTQHLGLRENDSGSDGEEEFYYTEIEVNVDAVAQGISDMYIPSHPADSYMSVSGSTIPDHDYQKKESKLLVSSVPSGTGMFHIQYDNSTQVNIPQMKRSISLQNNNNIIPTFSSSPTSTPIRMPARPSPQERLQQHQAQSPKNHMLSSPPKSSGIHKKSRSEVRKCRKVYGMENRDMWCTQCKWKKACTRFLD